jgi:outer membrane receptor protein involved in Fe transport
MMRRPLHTCPTLLLLALAGMSAAERPAAIGSGDEDVEVLRANRLETALQRRMAELARTPQPVEVLTTDDLLDTPAWTIPDRLRYVAGVDVYQLRHGQFEVGIRGWNGPFNNRLLLLNDGQMQRIEELGVVPWVGTAFLSDIDRIEVAKGPSSVTYGANAFGGVIDLRSRPVGDHHRLAVAGSLGTPAGGDADATGSGPLGGPLYYKIGVGATRLDDLPTTDSGAAHQPSSRTAHSGRTDLASDRSRVVIGATLPADLRAEAVWLRTDHHPWEVVNGASTGSGVVTVTNDNLSVQLTAPWFEATLARHWLNSDFQNQVPAYDPSLDFFYLQFGFRDVRDSARLALRFDAGPNRLLFGGELMEWTSRSNLWTRRGVFSDQSTWGEVRTVDRAVFVEDQVQVAAPVVLTAGVRADDHSRVGRNVSPRAAINWVPTSEQFVLLAYSSGYRQPTGLELFQTDYFLQPNDDLRAETIHAVELQWKRSGSDGLDWTLGGFANRSNHLIMRLPLPYDQQVANFTEWLVTGAGADPTRGPGPVFRYENIDNPVRVYGAEASVRLRMPGSPWSLWANGTWQRFRYAREIHFSSPGLTVPVPGGPTFYRYDVTLPRNVNEPPPWKVTAGGEWQDKGGLFASVVGRAVAGRYAYDLGHSLYATRQFVAAQRLPSYACLDLAVGWRLPGVSGCQVRLACLDVFDSSHHEHYEATKDTLNAAGEDQLASTVGRQARATLAWVF